MPGPGSYDDPRVGLGVSSATSPILHPFASGAPRFAELASATATPGPGAYEPPPVRNPFCNLLTDLHTLGPWPAQPIRN